MSNKYPGGIISLGGPNSNSVSFDGSGDYLTAASGSSAISFGTGDFTIEGWFNASATSSNAWTPFAAVGANSAGQIIRINQNVNNTGYYGFLYPSGGTDAYTTSGTAFPVGQWVHLALVRNGSDLTLYANGNQVAQATGVSFNFTNTTNAYIGYGAYSADGSFNGLISNFRIVKGTAVYTANFVPPIAPLQNIPGTSLLTCQSPTIIDNSSNAFTITVNGNSAVSSATPFSAYNPNNLNPALGAATNGVWTIDQALNAEVTRSWPMYDPYYNYVTLNLHGNQPGGVSATTNNTFLDSSSNNFTITRNGNTTQGSFTPYQQNGYWSNYFNGSSSYLTVPDNAALELGTSDFTIEGWFYPLVADRAFVSKDTNFNVNYGNLVFGTNSSGVPFLRCNPNAGNDYDRLTLTATSAILGRWSHVAATRSGSTWRIFVNGVLENTATSTVGYRDSSSLFYFGCTLSSNNPADFYTGSMSNFRLVKGTALYTASFTPSTTPLTNVTNTSLLTCQSNRFIDNSSNAFTITTGGTPTVQAFQPFLQNLPYESSRLGGSGYFDGSGDYLTTPSDAAFSYGTDDFSQEFWIYLTTSPSTFQRPFQYSDDRDNIIVESGNFNFYDGTASTISAATTGQWFHLCVTRVSGTLRGFVNGKLGFTRSGSYNSSTRSLALGATSGGANPLGGYTTNYRIVKGGIPSAYSTSSTTVGAQIFTPPTAPFTGSESLTAGSVSLLCNFTNGAIFDNAAMNDLETAGGAAVSTTQSKYGGASMYFDGTGDYLSTPVATLLSTSVSFTVEAWVYTTSTAAQVVFYLLGATNSYAGLRIGLSNSKAYVLHSQNGTGWAINTGEVGSVPTNKWNHIAVTRDGNAGTLWINGFSAATWTFGTLYAGSVNYVGAMNSSGPTDYMVGYIDDVRITNGVARYTATFTPPTSQVQDQ